MRYAKPLLPLLFGLLLVQVLGCGLGNDLEATILFKSAEGLKPGDLVLHKGFTIGAVKAVELMEGERPAESLVHVRVAFEEEYAGLLYHQMLFVVERDKLFSSDRHIEVYERAVKQPVPILDGEFIIGSTQADRYLSWAKDQAAALLEQARALAGQTGFDAGYLLEVINEGLEQRLDSEALKNLLYQLEQAKEEASDQVQTLLDQLAAHLKSQAE